MRRERRRVRSLASRLADLGIIMVPAFIPMRMTTRLMATTGITAGHITVIITMAAGIAAATTGGTAVATMAGPTGVAGTTVSPVITRHTTATGGKSVR